jgi:hypothetical protein
MDKLTELSERLAEDGDAYARLIEFRGGCSCHVAPPCGACSNPLTEEEAKALGWMDDTHAEVVPEVWRKKPETEVDYMAVVRSMSRGL